MNGDRVNDQATVFSPNGHKRAVLYARVSGDDRGKDGRNLKSQIEMGRQFVQERGYRIVDELSEDDKGASGASFDLPQLGRVLDMAERHEFDVLVVREIDRLSRNLAKQLIVEERLRRCGISIEYVVGEYADNPEGNLMKHVRASIAEYEREKIRERMERGKRNVVKGGQIMLHGDRPPYGYKSVLAKKNGKSVVVGIKVHEPEAKIVRLIYGWYTEGDENGDLLSAARIAKKLTGMRVPTWGDSHRFFTNKQKGYAVWAGKTVLDILHSETYIGKWHYQKIRSKDQWLTVNVPRIVTDKQWKAAQKQCSDNSATASRNLKREYLMRCRLKCTCTYAVSGHSVYVHGNTYHYYQCSSYLPDVVAEKCGLPNYRADHLDALVWNWVKDWFKDPADLRRKLEAYMAERARANGPLYALLQANDDLIAENQTQLDRLVDLYLTGQFSQEALLDRKTRLEDTLAKLRAERSKLQERLGRELSEDDITELVTFAHELSKGLNVAEKRFETRRHIISLLDVRAILAVEGDEKVLHVSFVLGGEHKTRLVMPKRGEGFVVEDTSSL